MPTPHNVPMRVRLLWLVSAGLALSACAARSRHSELMHQRDTLTASLQAEIHRDQVKIDATKEGIRVRMSDDLLYVPGSVELDPKGQVVLGKVARQLALINAYEYDIDIVAHTDDKPVAPKIAEQYPTNWELAGARAAAVVRYLQQQGIDPTKLAATSAGQYHPLGPNDTVAGRARNRRTDLVLRLR